MRRWSRSQRIQKPIETDTALDASDYLNREIGALRVRQIETLGTGELFASEAVSRAFCHLAVDYMPQEGLAEMVEQIIKMLDFYVNRPESVPQLSSPKQIFKAKISAVVTVPPFSLDEDEY